MVKEVDDGKKSSTKMVDREKLMRKKNDLVGIIASPLGLGIPALCPIRVFGRIWLICRWVQRKFRTRPGEPPNCDRDRTQSINQSINCSYYPRGYCYPYELPDACLYSIFVIISFVALLAFIRCSTHYFSSFYDPSLLCITPNR